MSYVNPLHPSVFASQQSSYSSLGAALNGGVQGSGFLVPHRRRLPQAIYAPTSKWHNSTGRTNPVSPAIQIDYIGYTKQGIPMREFTTRSIHALGQMIVGPNDQVLKHTGNQRITFRILWPGYAHVDWARSIEINTNGPITRTLLAAAICANFSRFIEMNRNERCTAPDYQIAAGRIQFEHLILVSLQNVFEDVWQAEVAIDLR